MDILVRMDRGTLVITTADGGVPAAAIPGTAWDARVGALRAPAYRLTTICRTLGERGARYSVVGSGASGRVSGFTAPELRPYQEAALHAWSAKQRRGIVVLPTGAGKTRLGVAAMAATRCRTLVLVPTRVLMHQWRGIVQAQLDGPVGLHGDGHHDLRPVTIATYDSAYLNMARIGHLFELLVVDEVHHFGRGVRDEALEMCAAPARLGLTATPDRDAAERLDDLVGPVVFERRIADLAGSFLAPFDLVELGLELTEVERKSYQADHGRFSAFRRSVQALVPDADWKAIATAAAASDAGREAMAAWRRVRRLLALTQAKLETVGKLLEEHRERKVLIFTADNAAAYQIARTHLVMPITCDIARKERDAALEGFRTGALRALVSSRVLNEGLDVPEADVGIVVGGAQGAREHVQRIGRLLRPAPGKRAIVYELVSRGTVEVRSAFHRRDGLGHKSPQAA